MRFVKMHGTGNDYIYVNLFEGFEDSVAATYDDGCGLLTVNGEPVEKLAIRISERHCGVGSDGLICIAPPSAQGKAEGADVRMIMFNLDGSEGMMCGNGIRCVAKFAFDKGLIPEVADKNKKSAGRGSEDAAGWLDDGRFFMRVETASGIKALKLTIENDVCTYVEVNMGQAILKPEEIPVDVSEMGFVTKERLENSGYKFGEVTMGYCPSVKGVNYDVTCVSMGNPHCIVFCRGPKNPAVNTSLGSDIDAIDLEAIGPYFEHHQAFPEQINTEFVEVIDDHTLKMRVWERGSGETMSCGTGTCAVTVAAVLNGFVKRGTEVEVQVRGGSLYDTWLESGEVLMKGPATVSFSGDFVG